MESSKKKIYIFGCTMWDIVGKPAERISSGKDCPGIITERPGGVAFNVATGLSKNLNAQGFELNLVSVIGKNKAFIQFEDNKWLRNKDLREITHFEKNYKKILRLFLNSKYKWGGKSADGIDCSALIQIYYYYNRTFFPRDTKDQVKYCKKKISKNLSEGDIVFWKGHVGMCLNKHQFIHAYGPRKKVVIMPTKFTIMLIDKTANLHIIKISNIKKY